MLLSVPLFRAIKEKIPDCELSLVVSPENVSAVEQNKYLDNVILFDKKNILSIKYWKYLWTNLRKVEFDIGFVPSTVSISFTSNLILRFSKCKYRIGPNSLNGKINLSNYLFNSAVDFDWRNLPDVHVSERIQKILEPMKIKTDDLRSHILLNNSDKKFADDFFKNINKPKIGLHIGAAKVNNRWSVQNFAELILKLKQIYDPLIYLTIGEKDENLLRQLLTLLNFEPMTLRNRRISEVAAVIDNSNLFVSNDTGILHVAGTTKCAVIGLFGPTEAKVWAPVGEKKFWIQKGGNVNLISVKDVLDLIERISNEIN